MLEKIYLTSDWRGFKTGDTFEFIPGINLLVGDQGSGKSSLIKAILSHVTDGETVNSHLVRTKCTIHHYDFEKDNLRIKGYFIDDKYVMQAKSKFVSHGEFNLHAVIGTAGKEKNAVFLMDEPDMALSIRSIKILAKTLHTMETNGCQVIAAVHNPYLIQAFSMVYDMEARQWVTPVDFISNQLLDR